MNTSTASAASGQSTADAPIQWPISPAGKRSIQSMIAASGERGPMRDTSVTGEDGAVLFRRRRGNVEAR
jgi:hypothetical protein